MSIADEERDPDSSKIQTLSVTYTAGDKIELALKMDDVSQKALNQISDDETAVHEPETDFRHGRHRRQDYSVGQFGRRRGRKRKKGQRVQPATSGNFELQIDSEASAANLLGNSTQDSIDGKKILNVGGTVSLTNELTIAAGTQVIFGDNASLEGKLTCQGTAKDPSCSSTRATASKTSDPAPRQDGGAR